MEKHRQEAERFLKDETQFRLGVLVTEQSHPRTRGLAEVLQKDVPAGIRMLQSVDQDVAASAARVFGTAAFEELVHALYQAVAAGKRVCFSGCGATGRLSILLEACWRRFWRGLGEQQPGLASGCSSTAARVCSIMTGGDYALVRSVEGFEDYPSFGRRQVIEAGIGPGDVLVAVSEGGETSSVIGTVHEALAREARVFFVFNNPPEILCEHVQRSREVIECPKVTVLDLSSGPMAVAGSTRMQATTAELLVLGTALERALLAVLPEVLPSDCLGALPADWRRHADSAVLFRRLLEDLASPAALEALAAWVCFERDLYLRRGRITYFASECLLDIFTDTTERAPTFMLPPFRKSDDSISPPSWAFVKHPLLDTPSAWRYVLEREPRCLEWNEADYRALGGPAHAQASPPRIGREELLKFLIGREDDPSRYEAPDSAAMAVLLCREIYDTGFSSWWEAFETASEPFRQRLAVTIGFESPLLPGVETRLHIPCVLEPTPLRLWDRLAVKLALNTVSTATMGCLGRLVSNWMANVEPSNKKLIDRGTRLVAELTGVDYDTACYTLYETMADLAVSVDPGAERPSPVAEAIRRLREKKD